SRKRRRNPLPATSPKHSEDVLSHQDQQQAGCSGCPDTWQAAGRTAVCMMRQPNLKTLFWLWMARTAFRQLLHGVSNKQKYELMTCSKKRRFGNRQACEAATNKLTHRFPLRAYECRVCGGWHRTKHPEQLLLSKKTLKEINFDVFRGLIRR